MASPINFNFPYFPLPPPHQPFQPSPPPYHPATPPPPPYHPITPPPPHVHPPPPPLARPPPPSPNNHTIIIVVFVSCGGVFFLAFLAVALFCFLKKKKKEKAVQEKDVVHVDEHMKVKEAIVPRPHGPRAVLLEIEDDVHINEEIIKTQRIEKGSNLHSSEKNPKDIEAGDEASSSSHQHQLEHKA